MDSFINPTMGGLLIGIASVLMMLTLGRICGISGIINSATKNLFIERLSQGNEHAWRWLFLLGLMLGPLVTHHVFSVDKPAPISANWALIIISALLVGAGTKLGSGCTSGHGVCGIARLSVRSIVATLTFMLVAVVTVTMTRHILQ